MDSKQKSPRERAIEVLVGYMIDLKVPPYHGERAVLTLEYAGLRIVFADAEKGEA